MNFENFTYEGFDEKANVFVNSLRDISRIYRLTFPQFLTQNEDYYNQLNEAIRNGIKEVMISDQSYAIQRTTFFKNKYPDIPIDETDSFFEIQKKKMHRSLIQNQTENYLTISLKTNPYDHQGTIYDMIEKIGLSSGKSKKLSKKKTVFDENLLKRFNRNSDHIINAYKFSKHVDVESIRTTEKLHRLLYNAYYNLGLTMDEPDTNVLRSIVRDPHNSYYSMGGKVIKVYNIIPEGFSSYIDEPFVINPIYNLPQSFGFDLSFGQTQCEKIVNQIIYTKPTKELLNDIYKTQSRIKIFEMNPERKERLLKSFCDINEGFLIDNEVVQFHYSMMLIGDKKEERRFLEQCEEQENFFKRYDITISDNLRNSNRYYLFNGFGNTHYIPETDRSIMPLKNSIQYGIFEDLKEQKYNKGIWLKQRFSNNDYFLDLLNIKSFNKNIVLMGRSGTGKSVTVGYFLESFYNDGATVYLTDVGFSQKNLCKKLGGIYIEITEKNPVKLNPFSILDYDEKNQEYIILKNQKTTADDKVKSSDEDNELEYLVNLFFSAWKAGEESPISNEQETVLSKIITRYILYVNKNNTTPNYNDFYLFSVDYLEKDDEFKNLREDLFDKQSFKLVMSDYLKEDKSKNIKSGRYYYLFDEDTEMGVKLKTSRFVVFEFESIKDNKRLFNICNFLISSLVKRRMLSVNSMGSKMVYAKDECHLFLEDTKTLGEIVYASRTFRKHQSTLFLATQSIEDFQKHEGGRIVIKQSSIRMLKKPQEEERKLLRILLDLSENSIKKVYSIDDTDKNKSIYINIDGEDIVMNLLLDRESLLLAETDKTVRTHLSNAYNRTSSIVCAVKNVIDQKLHIPKASKTL